MSRIGMDLIFLAVIITWPVSLWATGGPHDYGIIMAVMCLFYSFPVGLMLLGFIVYSIITLNWKKRPGKKFGKIMYPVSIITIPPAIIMPILWIYWADRHQEMIEIMLAVFIPVLILSIISIILISYAKKQLQLTTDDNVGTTPPLFKKTGITGYRHAKLFILGSILVLLLFFMLIFKHCFT